MKKVFTVILLTFLLSGCSMEYKLNIDENLSIQEDIVITEENKFINTFTIDIDEFVSQAIIDYSSDPRYLNYSIRKDLKSTTSSGIGTAKYLDFEQYKNKNTLKDYFFSSVSMSKSDDIVTLSFISNSKNELFEENSNESSILSTAKLTIVVPFRVTKSNADSIDKEKNAYTWNYNKESYNKDIYLVFDTSAKQINIKIPSWALILGGIVLVITMLGLYIYYKYKKNSIL